MSIEPVRRWLSAGPWRHRARKGAALARGGFQHLPVSLLDGVEVRLPLSAHRHYWTGCHPDQKLFGMLADALRPGAAFLDVGANIGVYSAALHRMTRLEPTLVAFEPIPTTASLLRELMELNSIDAVIEPVAVSSTEGTVRLTAYGGGANNRWIRTSRPSDGPTIEVPTIRLDHWLQLHPGVVPSACKIDVEGHELEVIKGALEAFRAYQPLLVVECHCASWRDLEVSREEFIHVLDCLDYRYLHDIQGRQIDFQTRSSTVHLICHA